ncbi:LamG-like jellyroll fold domain-containing protein [Pedosphaera parvula]|uniref:Autotransporter-associated beta strand repeat protein n=1 Tax=Pedosphaera parvula (strain Ellin514) TaxID=320771 RepID=B9XKT5_PEDPL|nr:LamG-like jellyroll fold domain-containing protein [Pedosphaera parvula]EEF59578.1 autotransporter-associated beta strand repeat protein [Pedosphaera parvula Ellin514]
MTSLFGDLFRKARQRAIFIIRLGAIVTILQAVSFNPAAASPPPGYYLAWGDEFNGTSLDTSKWTYWLPGKWNDAVNVTNAVTVNGSNLVITTYSAQGTNYSAMLASQFHFHPRYGYYESSIQWGNSNGNWSAFWLRSPTMGTYLDDAYVSGGEMDVCEHRYVGIYGTNISKIVSDNIHWNGYGAAEQDSGSPNVGNVATGFHTYGLLWNGGTYSFSIDGGEVWNANGTGTPVFGSDAYVILSSEVNDTSTTWAGYIPASGYGSQATSTVKMTVDYFRYYAPTNVLFWTGTNSTAWNNSANWVANLTPGAASDLTFSYLSANLNSVLGANMTVDGLVFLETANSASIGGANTLTLGSGGIDMVAANQNVALNAPITVGSNQRWTVGRNNPGNRLTVNGNIGGTASLTKAGYGTLVLNGTNSFSGALNVDTGGSATNDGKLIITSSAAIANVASPIFIRNTGTAVSTLELSNSVVVSQNVSLAGRNTNAAAIEALSGSNSLNGGITLTGGGSNYVLQSDSGLLQVSGSISAGSTATGPCILTFQGSGDFSIPATIQNGSSSALSVVKTNSGTLILSGLTTYTGGTTNWGGTLFVNGSLAGQLVIMGGVLVGVGTVAGDTTLQGGEISPGSAVTNSIGKLSFGGNLTLGPGAVTAMEVSATAQTNDQLNVAGTLNLGGTLYVINLGGTFAPGQSFKLFNSGNCVGTFSALVLPWLSAGMAWNTNDLTNGILSIAPAPRPLGPTTAYAAAIRAYQPAGYWPLQETNAPASAATETNLGSLGSVGNAYYVDTNPTDVTLGVPGGLAADTDTAVAFNSAAQTFAFVPRASPTLTLMPPFTIETWFKPQTAVYGVILGEGGGASLNGGPTYGGFQFGWAGGNKTRFESQLYHYGINASSLFDTPTGYSVNTWCHYVFTYDTSSTATMYVNGQAMASATLSYVADNWSPLTIGNGKWNGLGAQRAVNGTIDEVAVYTNLLSPSDISAHYSAGTNNAPATAYKQLVLNNHPLLYFRMNNPGSSIPGPAPTPVAVNFGSAPVDGAYLPGTVPAGVSGPSATGMGTNPAACMLNGIFSCIDAGYDTAFNPTNTQPFTALLWFKGYPADSSVQTLMGHGATSWAISLDGSTGDLIWNSGAGFATSPNVYNDGSWHQVAGVYDGATNYLYVDGVLRGANAATGTIAGNTNNVYLGGDPDNTRVGVNERYFAGAITQAAFFTNALSPVQIQATYQAALTPPPLSLGIRNVNGNQVELNWNYGTLQAASNVNGPYTDLPGASQPYTIPTTSSQLFYRVRR